MLGDVRRCRPVDERARLKIEYRSAYGKGKEVATMPGKRWAVDVVIDEDAAARRTHAHATLHTEGADVGGEGEAKRDPDDVEQPSIGDKIAVARALLDLAQTLLRSAEVEISAVTHQPAHVHR